jgi:presequence protease
MLKRILTRGLHQHKKQIGKFDQAYGSGILRNMPNRIVRSFIAGKAEDVKKQTIVSGAVKHSAFLAKLKGDNTSAWKLDWIEGFTDLNCSLLRLTHTKSGLVHYHLDQKDPHLMMGITFKTDKFDKSKRDHLLQKILLAGSEKYPVRDCFAYMLDRSLGESTSGGAWSGGEFTAYNFGSRNKADFYNLLQVYMEALYNPRFIKADFLEEGWRLEFSTPSDTSTPLILRGREVNEARKSMVDVNRIAIESVYNHLFYEKQTLKEVSIHASERLENLVELDYEGLKEYHRLVYHPSNMTIFTYGELDLSEFTAYLESMYLSSISPLSPDDVEKLRSELFKQHNKVNAIESGQSKLLPQIDLNKKQPRKQLVLRCPKTLENTSITGGGSCIGLAFPCNLETSSSEELAALSVLSTLLFELPQSPLFRDFLESGVAGGYIPGYGFEPNMSNPYFTVGLKGIREGTEDATIEMLRFTISKAAKEGFNDLEIESLLTQIELSAKTPTEDFGMRFFQSYIGALTRRSDSELKSAVGMDRLLKSIASRKPLSKYFQSLVKKYLVDSPECLEIKIIPSQDYYDDVEIAETRIIRSKLEGVTDRQAFYDQIMEESDYLRQEKEQLQDVECLPKLTVKDFATQVEKGTSETHDIQGIRLAHFHTNTHGTTHFRVKIDVSDLDQTQLKYLALAARIFPNIGTFAMKPMEILMTKQLYLGDFSFQLISESSPSDANKPLVFVIVQGHSLDRHVEKLLEIFTALLSGPDFKDLQTLSRLLKVEAAEAATRIGGSPLNYTLSYAQSSQRKPHALNNKLVNVSQAHLTKRIGSYASWVAFCSLL